MSKQRLLSIFRWFQARPGRLTALRTVNLLCTGITYAVFAFVVGWLALHRSPVLLQLLITCGVPFVVLSVFRRLLNWPRPYEVYDIPPLLHKETRGRSFPSRHVFSICVIGTSLLYIFPPLGAVLLVLGILLAAVRVLSGVHFLRDVAAGALIGIFAGAAGFSLLPMFLR